MDSFVDIVVDVGNLPSQLSTQFTLSEQEFRDIGDEVIRGILDNTSLSVDVEGNPFVDYSLSYAKRRHRKGLSANRVDLRVTGDMLGAMRSDPNAANQEVRIFFGDADAERIASGHTSDHRPRGMPKRKFFGVTKEAYARALQLVRKGIGL